MIHKKKKQTQFNSFLNGYNRGDSNGFTSDIGNAVEGWKLIKVDFSRFAEFSKPEWIKISLQKKQILRHQKQVRIRSVFAKTVL